MAYTGVQDQLELVTWLLDNASQVEAGKRSLWSASDQVRSAIGKLAGCTPAQVALWSRGQWSPPTVQRLSLMKAAAEHGAQYTGRAAS